MKVFAFTIILAVMCTPMNGSAQSSTPQPNDIQVELSDGMLTLRASNVTLAELLFEIGHVVIPVAESFGFAQPDAVDDRGVIERVGDNGIFRPEQGLEEPPVGVETRGIQDRVLGPREM